MDCHLFLALYSCNNVHPVLQLMADQAGNKVSNSANGSIRKTITDYAE